MINLLPNQDKENITYARRNSQLVKWITAVMIGIVGIVAVVAFGQFYLTANTKTYARQVANSEEQLKLQKLDETQQRVTNISSSLKLVLQVLGKQVLFSKLIRQVGGAIPAGAALTNLTIGKTTGGIDLQFDATDYQTATQIQLNLQDKANGIFDTADIVNINCGSTAAADERYPCQVIVRAQFLKDNPFLFINTSSAVKKP